jgi:integrase
LGEAFKRRRISVNPAELAKPPRVEEEEVEPFEAEEIHRLLRSALARRNGVRFVVALALGIRQGEALGSRWSRLDDETRTLQIRKAIQRRTWQHGCENPHACGAKYHKTKPCRAGCKRHQRPCPLPCPPDCTSHARWCPQRHGGGLVEVDVKSQAGRRGIALPDELFTLITAHCTVQEQERQHAGSEWHKGDWMFTQPNGKPLDPRRDQYEWKTLLAEAGVREARLHDARHTAATVLLLLGVHERAVMDVMGWSNSAMVKRYAHVTARLRRDIADQLNSYFWAANETKTETAPTYRRPDLDHDRGVCAAQKRWSGAGSNRRPSAFQALYRALRPRTRTSPLPSSEALPLVSRHYGHRSNRAEVCRGVPFRLWGFCGDHRQRADLWGSCGAARGRRGKLRQRSTLRERAGQGWL